MADVYQTRNSTYVIDLDQNRYKRLPINVNPAHVDSERGRYNEWLPLKDPAACAGQPVDLVKDPFKRHLPYEDRPLVLHILHKTSTVGIFTTEVLFVAKNVDPAEWEA